MAGHASRTGKATGARTLFDKVFDAHVVTEDGNGQSLLWIDRHLLHEGSHHAFNKLKERDARVRRPDLTFGIEDHYVPTRTHDLTHVVRERLDFVGREGLLRVGRDEDATMTQPGLVDDFFVAAAFQAKSLQQVFVSFVERFIYNPRIF